MFCVRDTDASKLIRRYHNFRHLILSQNNEQDLESVLKTINTSKTEGKHRLCLWYESKKDLVSKLSKMDYKQSHAIQNRDLVMVFQGQGSSYFGVGQYLFQKNIAFKKAMNEVVAQFKQIGKDSFDTNLLMDELLGKRRNDDCRYPLVKLFTFQYSFLKFWQSLGIVPTKVVCHSDGEYAALVATGCISMKKAVEIVCIRENILGKNTDSLGAMAVIRAGKKETQSLIEKSKLEIFSSCFNNPTQTVVSGKREMVEQFVEFAKLENKMAMTLKLLKYPFHCELLSDIAEEFGKTVSSFTFEDPKIPFYSSIFGKRITKIENIFFSDQICKPVRFQEAVEALNKEKTNPLSFLEIGTKNVATKFVEDILGGETPNYSYAIHTKKNKKEGNWSAILKMIGNLYLEREIDLNPIFHQHKKIEINESVLNDANDGDIENYEPIAIVGYSCKFPDGIDTSEKLFARLIAKKDAITKMPKGRFVNSIMDRSDVKPPKTGGYIKDAFAFDRKFWDFNEISAETMDPQQRIIIELVFEALERACIIPSDLKKPHLSRKIGCFIGKTLNDYAHRISRGEIDSPFTVTGNSPSATSAIITKLLNIEGPAITLDTACSSSLSAIHNSIKYLHSKEIEMAIVGATNIVLMQTMNIGLTKAKMLSKEGKSFVFTPKANGYGRSDGCCICILKTLKKAIKDKDNILGVIRSTCIRTSGKRDLITLPTSCSQSELMSKVIRTAKLKPNDIDYVESHGTGTPIGDPTELRAIYSVFNNNRTRDLTVRSAKGSIGHAETTAGFVGLLSTIESMKNQEFYPQCNFDKLNPKFEYIKEAKLKIEAQKRQWNRFENKPRRAIINSFGFTGVDCSLVLEEYLEKKEEVENKTIKPKKNYPFIISAKSQSALTKLKEKYIDFLNPNNINGSKLNHICFSETCFRENFVIRDGLFVSSKEELIKTLAEKVAGKKIGDNNKGACFMFSGQGGLKPNVTKDLYEEFPVFRENLELCFTKFEKMCGLNLKKILFCEENDKTLFNTRYNQPLSFVVQYAMCKMYEFYGVSPSFVIGHSNGEFCAMVISQVITLEEAIIMISKRSEFMAEVKSKGKMIAVMGKIHQLLQKIENDPKYPVEIAGINSNNQIVLSGDEENISIIEEQLKGEYKVVRLNTSNAFHSRIMNSAAERFLKFLEEAKIDFKSPTIPFFSTLKGKEILCFDNQYFYSHIVQPVQWVDAFSLVSKKTNTFLEIGPNSTLSRFCTSILSLEESNDALVSSCLKKKEKEVDSFRNSLIDLYKGGNKVEWSKFFVGKDCKKTVVPTYQYDREHLMISELATGECSTTKNPLIGSKLELNIRDMIVYDSILNPIFPVFMKDHSIYGTVLLSGSSYISSVLACIGEEQLENENERLMLENFVFLKPVVTNDYNLVHLQTILKKNKKNQYEARCCSLKNGKWDENCTGKIIFKKPQKFEALIEKEALTKNVQKIIEGSEIYQISDKMNLHLGNSYRWIKKIYIKNDQVIAEFKENGEAPSGLETSKTNTYEQNYDNHRNLHPGLIDSIFQIALGLNYIPHLKKEMNNKLRIPVSLKKFYFENPYSKSVKYAKLSIPNSISKDIDVDIEIFSEEFEQIGMIGGLRLHQVDKNTLLKDIKTEEVGKNEVLYQVIFKREEIDEFEGINGNYIIFTDDSKYCTNFIHRFKDSGKINLTLVRKGDCWNENENGNFVINPQNEEDYYQLFNHFQHQMVHCVIYLWNSEANHKGNLENGIKKGFSFLQSLYMLFRSVSKVKFENVPKCFVQTNEVYSLDPQNQSHMINVGDNLIAGFIKSISLEIPTTQPTLVDFGEGINERDKINCMLKEIQVDINKSSENQIIYHINKNTKLLNRYLPRLEKIVTGGAKRNVLSFPESDYYVAKPKTDESGQSLINKVFTKNVPNELNPEEVFVQVKAASVNFRDVLNSMNMYIGEDSEIGCDFAGVICKLGKDVKNWKVGDKVFGISERCYGSKVSVNQKMIRRIPENLSYAVASSIPVIYYTSHYSLQILAKIKKNDTVLIHSATGGVGLAALHICRSVGCKIIVTAGKQYKRDYLASIGCKHIFDSHNAEDYGKGVMEVTNGKGVDVILNSLTGEGFIQKNIEICAKNARFIEIAKRNIWVEQEIKNMKNDITYHVFEMKWKHFYLRADVMSEIMEKIQTGEYKTIPTIKFSINDFFKCYKFILGGNHIGKCVIVPLSVTQQVSKKSATLITGGLGGIGLAYLEFLIKQKNENSFILAQRSTNSEKQEIVQKLKKENPGVDIIIKKCDVTKVEEVDSLIKYINEKYNLTSIFHAAGVLRDGRLSELSWNDFETVLGPKVFGTYYLHSALEKYKIDPTHFILFSSVVSVYGSPGQSNYCSGNHFLDGFAIYRRQMGRNCQSLNLGGFDIGMVKNSIGTEKLTAVGMTPLTSETGCKGMSQAIKTKQRQCLVVDMNWKIFIDAIPQIKMFFENVTDVSSKQLKTTGILKRLINSEYAKRKEILENYVLKLLKSLLGDQIPSNFGILDSISALGIDSFTFERIRNNLYRTIDKRVNLSIGDLIHYPSITSLSIHILERLSLSSSYVVQPKRLESDSQSILLPKLNYKWFISSVFKNSGLYHTFATKRISKKENFNLDSFTKKIKKSMELNSLFSIFFRDTPTGDILLKHTSDSKFPLFSITKIGCSGKKEKEIDVIIEEETKKSFDLSKPPILRVSVINKKEESILLIVSHELLLSSFQLSQYLETLISNPNSQKKFTSDEFISKLGKERIKAKSNAEKKIEFWTKFLKDANPWISLPLDYQRKRFEGFNTKTMTTKIDISPSSISKKLPGMKEKNFFISSFILGLNKLTKETDLLFGIKDSIEDDILPFRIKLNQIGETKEKIRIREINRKVEELIQKTSLFANGSSVYSMINEIEEFPSDLNIHPIVNVLFQFNCDQVVNSTLDLVFTIKKEKNLYSVVVNYNGKLFKSSTISKYLSKFQKIMKNAIKKSHSFKIKKKKEKKKKIEAIQKQKQTKKKFFWNFESLKKELMKNKLIKDLFFYEIPETQKLISYVVLNSRHSKEYEMKEIFEYISENAKKDQPKEFMDPLIQDFQRILELLKIKKLKDFKNLLSLQKIGKKNIFDILPSNVVKKLENKMKTYVANKLTKEVKSDLVKKMIGFLPEEFVASTFFEVGQRVEDLFFEILDQSVLEDLEKKFNEFPNYCHPEEIIIIQKIPYLVKEKKGKGKEGKKKEIDFDNLPKSNSIAKRENIVSRKMLELLGTIKEDTTGANETKEEEEKRSGDKQILGELKTNNLFDLFEVSYSSPSMKTIDEICQICANVFEKRINAKEKLFVSFRELKNAIKCIYQLNRATERNFTIDAVFRDICIETIKKNSKKEKKNELKNKIDPILIINKGNPKIHDPVWLIHPATGLSHSYLSLKRFIDKDIPVYGLHNPLFGKTNNFKSVQDMAYQYMKYIMNKQQTGSYTVGGWSFGGTLAVEVARLLQENNQSVEIVILFDTFNFSFFDTSGGKTEKDKKGDKKTFNEFFVASQIMSISNNEQVRKELTHNLILSSVHNIEPYHGRVVLIKAQRVVPPFNMVGEHILNGFDNLFTNLEITSVPESHFHMFYGDTAKFSAEKIKEFTDFNGSYPYVLQKQDISKYLRIALLAASKSDFFVVNAIINDLETKGQLYQLNAQDFKGKTLLHHATEKNSIEMITRLVKLGVDTSIKDFSGKTALKIAEINNFERTKQHLLVERRTK